MFSCLLKHNHVFSIGKPFRKEWTVVDKSFRTHLKILLNLAVNNFLVWLRQWNTQYKWKPFLFCVFLIRQLKETKSFQFSYSGCVSRVLSWTEQCIMWVNVGDCSRINSTWRLHIDSQHNTVRHKRTRCPKTFFFFFFFQASSCSVFASHTLLDILQYTC